MFTSIKLGAFLAYKYIRRTSIWTTALVVFIMLLTFLNLVVISGILVGLIEGASRGYKEQYLGDVFVSTLPERSYIEQTPFVRQTIQGFPEVLGVSSRYTASAKVEVNYKNALGQRNRTSDSAGAIVAGINVEEEATVTNLHNSIVEGEFLEPGDENKIVIGALLLEEYVPGEFGFETLGNVDIGDKVRITIGDIQKEMTLKGITKTKADPADIRVYITDRELRNLLGRSDFSVNEISVRIAPSASPDVVKEKFIAAGIGEHALVRTNEEAIGQFIEDIRNTFLLLGNIVGGIGLAVASVTVFIVIFITAITRKKYIGILKGIGINGSAIELSYIMLSIFYALIGVGIGLLILYGVLVPYFEENPINFPFSDGILAVTAGGTALRSVAILLVTTVAGFIPAKIIVRKNTLDAILGR